MTFEQFQATRTHHADLRPVLTDGTWDDIYQPSGFVYLGQLCIEEINETWPEWTRMWGRYYLQIGNAEHVGNELEPLERILFEYA